MAISKRYCIALTILSILITAVIIVLCVWYLVPHDDNLNNGSKSNETRAVNFDAGLIIQKGTNEIQLLSLDLYKNETITLFKELYAYVNSFDYYRNKTLYYSSDMAPVRSVSKEYPDLMPSDVSWHSRTLAIDFVCKNVYVYDTEVRKIYLFDMRNKYHSIILSDLPIIKDIALNPFQRSMFLLTSSSIWLANMDGTDLKEIINEAMNIEAFALNLIGPYVYWAKGNTIMNLFYDTEPIKVATTPNVTRNLAVYGDDLYFTSDSPIESYTSELYHCKLTKGVCSEEQFEKISFVNPRRIRVYTPHLWETAVNPCKYNNDSCEHFCLFNGNNDAGYTCACTLGWQLNTDAKTCSPVDEYIMYANEFHLRGRVLERTASDRAFVDALSPKRLNIRENGTIEFDCDSRRQLVFFAEGYKLHRMDLLGGEKPELIGDDFKYMKYLAIDWIANGSLYYAKASRSMYEYESHLSLRGTHEYYHDDENEKRIYTFERGLRIPRALVVEPNAGYLFASVYEIPTNVALIYRIVADGSASSIFEVQDAGFSVNETSLGIDHVDGRLYWFSADLSQVQNAALNGSNFKSFDVSFVKEPIWINVHGPWLYLSNREVTWRVDKTTGQHAQRVLTLAEGKENSLSAAKGFGARLQPITLDHPCAVDNGGCRRYCIAVPGESEHSLRRVCACNDNEELQLDGESCVKTSSASLIKVHESRLNG